MEIREVTLMEILDSRENRASHQARLLSEKGGALVSITLNIPGPVKDRPEYRWAMETAVKRMKEAVLAPVVYEEIRYLPTGPEGYLSIDGDGLEIKKTGILTEEKDMLGRIFDIDVFSVEDGNIKSYTRGELGAGPRKCLICDKDAKVCARSRAHNMDELLKRIDEIIEGSK